MQQVKTWRNGVGRLDGSLSHHLERDSTFQEKPVTRFASHGLHGFLLYIGPGSRTQKAVWPD